MLTAEHPAPAVTELPAPKLTERARLVTIRTVEHAKAVMAAAAADAHQCIAPTHAMMRGEQVIGYLSLGGMPVVQAWFDSKSGHVRDSLNMIDTAEAIMATQGASSVALCCSEDSPFYPHLERLGFKPVMKTVLFVKPIP